MMESAVDPGIPSAPAKQRWLASVYLLAVLALTAYGVAVLVNGLDAVWLALKGIGGNAIAAGMGVTAVALMVRAWRWRLILQRMGHELSAWFNLRLYLSGLALSSTPGKIGETSRSLLLRTRGVPYPNSLAAFVSDRLSDVVGVALLGACMAALADARQPMLEGIAVFSLAGSLAAAAVWRSRPGRNWLASRRHWLAQAAAPAAVWAALWRGPALVLYILLAMVAYGLQGMLFAAFVGQVHHGLGLAPCLAIFVNATLIGAASMVPGGLGTMDAALVLQLHAAGVPMDGALAAAIATRVCTLWFAWMAGIGALLSFGRKGALS
jgi:glycosyltransferase 2 family protein